MAARKKVTAQAVADHIAPAIAPSGNPGRVVANWHTIDHWTRGGSEPADSAATRLADGAVRRRTELVDAIARAQAQVAAIDAVLAEYDMTPTLTPEDVRYHYQYKPARLSTRGIRSWR